MRSFEKVVSKKDSIDEEEFLNSVLERFKTLLDTKTSASQISSVSILSQYIRQESERLGATASRPISDKEYISLSNKYVEGLTSFIPDCTDHFNDLFDTWARLMRLGDAIGHVDIDHYGVRVMPYINVSYIRSCQAALQHVCNITNCCKEAFSIPTKPAIYAILKHSTKILVLDEGTGYWAHSLDLAGANVIVGNAGWAINQINYPAHRQSVYTLLKSKQYNDRALVFCPGVRYSISRHINVFKGTTFCYVGERNDSTDLDAYLKVWQLAIPL